MKKLFYIIFLLSVLLSSNNFANANDYSICATNADGAILVKEEDGDNTSFALASSPTDFSHANSSDPDRGGYCEVTPDNYKLKMYKIGLCTEDPYRTPESGSGNTIGADLTSCTTIFDDPAGEDVNIQPGVEVDLLSGGFTIPIGVYPYVFALIDNVVQIKHIQEYAAATGGDANFVIRGYDPDNNDGSTGTGKVCYTGLNLSLIHI